MRAFFFCAALSAILSTGAAAGENADQFSALLDARLAILDSIEVAVAPLTSNELDYPSQRIRRRHEVWVKATTTVIGSLRKFAGDFQEQPTLFNATRFELSWQRLHYTFRDASDIASDLLFHGMPNPGDGIPAEKVYYTRQRTAPTREAGSQLRRKSREIDRAMMQLYRDFDRVFLRYVLAASAELERTGWTP